MNKDTALIVSGLQSVQISTPEQARKRRDELLARARRGTIVNSPQSAENAAAILRDLKVFSRTVEDERKEVKRPVLEIAAKIDEVGRDLTGEIEQEAKRIGQLIGAYQAEQNRLAEQKRREQWEKEQQVKRDADEKQRLADEEARRKEQELRDRAEKAKSAAARKKLEDEAAALKEKNDKAAVDAQSATAEKITQDRQALERRLPPKPAGLATRGEIKFEVEDIAALYKAQPFLVLLTPNTAALKAALKALPAGGNLPGVRHWIEQKSIVR